MDEVVHRVTSEQPNSVFTVKVKIPVCPPPLPPILPPFLSVSHTHTHAYTHMHTLCECFFPSLSLLSVQLASGLHFPLEPVEGGALFVWIRIMADSRKQNNYTGIAIYAAFGHIRSSVEGGWRGESKLTKLKMWRPKRAGLKSLKLMITFNRLAP